MKNKIYKFILVLFLILGPVYISLAQTGPPLPPDPLGGSGTPGSMSCPIPDGIYILLILAGIYGVSKYLRVRLQGKTA